MKTLYIHSTIDSTKSALSLGSYWDCTGRQPVAVEWEYIGEEPELVRVLAALREDNDAEFMHIVNRSV